MSDSSPSPSSESSGAHSVFRPLYLAQRLTAALGTSISYAYDDLAFVEHSHVLFQFPESGKEDVLYYTNAELNDEGRDELRARYEQVASELRITLIYIGVFTMTQKTEREEVDIRLTPVL